MGVFMNAPLTAAAALALLLAPTVALAQDPMPPLPAPEEAPPPPPAAARVSAAAPAPVSCTLGGHAGIEDADAETTGRLVCDEIARTSPPPGAHYRVDIGKLGSSFILSVTREGDRPGTTADSRELRLQSIEEVSVAAPRLAVAIVHGDPIAETLNTENVVGEETRVPKTKPGSIHFGLGLTGLLPPLDQGAAPAAGVLMDWHYEARRLEMGVGLRGGGGSAGGTNSPSLGYFMVDVGGRYYFNDSDFSPYAGGGLEWMYLNLSVPNENFSGDNGGLGAFADAGVEILRTHHAHLAFGARVDFPFFSLQNSNSSTVYAANGPVTTTVTNTTYYAPISLEMRLTF
jgi:hypothetical protein